MHDNLTVREAAASDIDDLMNLDPSYQTDYVWQMDIDRSNEGTAVKFKQVKLPRSMQVEYPRSFEILAEEWKKRPGLLVAEMESKIIGYINMIHIPNTSLVSVTDLVIIRRLRSQGYGTALVQAGSAWAIHRGAARIVVEMQSKNYPAICLVSSLGFEFCGYNDRYYDNQDIALFFSKRI